MAEDFNKASKILAILKLATKIIVDKVVKSLEAQLEHDLVRLEQVLMHRQVHLEGKHPLGVLHLKLAG